MAESILKTCPQCGKVFVTEYPTKIYCNKQCANKASYERDEGSLIRREAMDLR